MKQFSTTMIDHRTHKRHASARENGRWNKVGPAGESLQKCKEVRFLHVTQAKCIDFVCSAWTINAAFIVQVYYLRQCRHRSVVHVGAPTCNVAQSRSLKRIAQCY